MRTMGTTLPGTGTSPSAATSPGGKDAIRPFHVEFSDHALADLRRRVVAMRWPPKELAAQGAGRRPVAGRAARDAAEAGALLGDRLRLAQGRGEGERLPGDSPNKPGFV